MRNNPPLPAYFKLTSEVATAIEMGQAVVALESAVITHGLPQPQNLELAQAVEQVIRSQGATPATTAILDGRICVGLTSEELKILASGQQPIRKISKRDFGIALARKEKGGTTVAGTLVVARRVGIRVFATGGIGGVHRDAPTDISADLPELGRSPVIVVCAGAKAILDLPATTEYLETMGVPIIGYQTDELPAFYSIHSGLPVTVRAESPAEIAAIALAQWELGIQTAVLVVVPPPPEFALAHQDIDQIINLALYEASQKNIRGSAVTPFLLARVSDLSGGSSLQANLALLKNNARVAAQIAVAMVQSTRYSTTS